VSLELVYETHAITTDNEAGIATGWLPGELSDAGVTSARQLGDRRRNDGIDVVYVSDLARAVQTVRLAFGDPAPIQIVEEARLRECNYGSLNGMTRARLDAERAEHLDEPWPGGESYGDVVRRTASWLEDVACDAEHLRVLVIAHSANHWALEHLLNGSDLAERVAAGMTWQPGWEYVLPINWRPTWRVTESPRPETSR
jgi:broad specificity phosphatase PhoE